MRRTPVIAGNWKMNKTTAEAVQLSQDISNRYDKALEDVEVVLCPPFTDIKSVWNVLVFDHSEIRVGAQDVHWEESGAYTGEISPGMLQELHCDYCIVGHSERRGYFHETDEDVNRKVRSLIAHRVRPIVCVGESLEVREGGGTLDFVADQVRAAFADVDAADIAASIVAYEPIWAIGTGRAATADVAEEVCGHIRGVVAELAGDEAAASMRILYGGSMNQGNAELFLAEEDVDGGLIGGAALDASAFSQIVETAHDLLRKA